MNRSIFLALDFPTWKETEHFLQTNHLSGIPVKVGMELFYREGPEVIKKLQAYGHSIFLDLKLHDISTTVYKAMRNLANLGVDFVNVHGFGGAEMIHAAKQGLLDGSSLHGKQPQLLVVTILTSIDTAILSKELGIEHPIDQMVNHFAMMAQQQGADGVVCSVHEAKQIKQICGEDFLTVIPGIRLADTEKDDQKRIATPELAKQLGSDYIVIGRSVTTALKPLTMYQRAVKEWNNVN